MTTMTKVGVEPTQPRLSTWRLYQLAYSVAVPFPVSPLSLTPTPSIQLQTWELNPASRLMRPSRAPARLQ